MSLKITSLSSNKIKQYTTDPTSPKAEIPWVLRQGTGGGTVEIVAGTPMGLLLALTYDSTYSTTAVAYSYQFSYRTKEGTTVRETLT